MILAISTPGLTARIEDFEGIGSGSGSTGGSCWRTFPREAEPWQKL